MKKYLILTFLLSSYLTVSSQQVEGIFINGTDSISFTKDKVSFRITGFAGLATIQVGEGEYEFIDDYLLVNTTDYPGPKTSFNTQEAISSDTCNVSIIGINNDPIQGILVESKNSSDKLIGASVTGQDGKIMITNFEKVSKITVSSMGYNPITFDFSPGNDYVVRVAENDIIENKTVVFNFNQIDNETITLILMSDDFDRNKNMDRELSRLSNRARRENLIEKRFSIQ